MHTLTPIEHLIDRNDWTRLLQRSLANSGSGPRTDARDIGPRLARRTLTEPEAVGPAALGVALQTLCRRSRGSGGQAEAIVTRLLDMQRRDGLFRTPNDHPDDDDTHSRIAPACLAATAVAIAGLRAWQRAHAHNASCFSAERSRFCGAIDHESEDQATTDIAVSNSIARALHGLGSHQHPNGLIANCPTATTITLWQLADDPAFRHAVDFFDLVHALKRFTIHAHRPATSRQTWTPAA